MTLHIPEESSVALIDQIPFVIPNSATPPRDPDDDEEDENGNEEDANRTDEPPVVREPDED
jgi:hypothetical protein